MLVVTILENTTILEALDIFFNEGKGCISLDKEDINKRASSEGDDEIIIAVEFFKLPDSLVIDDSNRTTLAAEYLLTESNTLKIVKRYPKAGRKKFIFELNIRPMQFVAIC